MASRMPVRRDRDNVDYSAIGTLGRRTGVTLDQRPLDANGMEEITGLFSSPRKPSPLKNMVIMEHIEERDADPSAANSPNKTPVQALSLRRSNRGTPMLPPRSASPRKSGVSGTARRANGVDIFSPTKVLQSSESEDRENSPVVTPTRISQRPFSSSPEKSPLRDITAHTVQGARPSRPSLVEIEQGSSGVAPSVEEDYRADLHSLTGIVDGSDPPMAEPRSYLSPALHAGEEADDGPLPEDHPQSDASDGIGSPPPEFDDDEEADMTFEPEPSLPPVEHNQANSRKKRTSEAVEYVDEPDSSPVPKKACQSAASTVRPKGKVKQKQPLREQLSPSPSRQEKELQDVIERVKNRPDPPRSLYILRRETPADDSVTHTRSGRISIKPLAYWRNERCIYGSSPGGGGLKDGARFPLNSIREIVRTEEIAASRPSKKKPGRRAKRSNAKASTNKAAYDSDSDSTEDSDGELSTREDPDAEPWEVDPGTLRGSVSVWDQADQAPMEEEVEVELAHAPVAVKRREVKGSNVDGQPAFQYTKLLSTRFFGTGLVELPPGGFKRPKNSRKMHMTFYVLKGRVTVTVGPIGGEETGSMTRFSIGKGGFWQVPRGNQYSIANESVKPARIFFSQGCEAAPNPTDED